MGKYGESSFAGAVQGLAIATTMAASALFYFFVQDVPSECPLSLRTGLICIAALNLVGSLAHCLLPDSGVSTVAGIRLCPKCNTMAVYFLGNEGQQRVSVCVVYIYAAIYDPKHTLRLLALHGCSSIYGAIIGRWFKTSSYKGENLLSRGPGKSKDSLNFVLVVGVVLCAYLNGDLHDVKSLPWLQCISP